MRMSKIACRRIVKSLEGHGEAAERRITARDVDKRQLMIGTRVEQEHVRGCKPLARRIALDHLAEDPEYYSKLMRAGL